MAIFVSSLIKGFGQMEEIARWVDGQGRDWLGVELIAFTHDEDYWERLNRLLPTLTCPLTFHGPYIGVEAASPRGRRTTTTWWTVTGGSAAWPQNMGCGTSYFTTPKRA